MQIKKLYISGCICSLLVIVLILLSSRANANEDLKLNMITTYDLGTNFRFSWHPVHDWLVFNGNETTTITIMDALTGEYLYALESPSEQIAVLGVTDIEWSENGYFLAVSFPNSIDVWRLNAENPTFYAEITFQEDDVYWADPLLAWIDNQLVTVISEDIENDRRRIQIWNETFNGILEESDLGEENRPYSVVSSPNGDLLAAFVSSYDPIIVNYDSIMILDSPSLELMNIFPQDYELPPAQQPIWLDDHTLIGISCAISYSECNLWKWNIDANQITTLLNDTESETISLRFSHLSLNTNLGSIAAIDTHAIHLIDVLTGNVILSLDNELEFLQSASWNASGDLLAVASGSEVQIWQLVD